MLKTDLKRAILLELKDRAEARISVAKLYGRIFPQYKLGAFHHRMAKPIDGFINGKVPRLIINIPPGHIKSLFASQLAPASYVGFEPHGKIVAGSYNSELAKLFGRETRNIIASPEYATVFPGTALRKDSKSAGRWNTSKGGAYVSAAVGKPVTGMRANRLIIDDPHADYTSGNDLRQTERDWAWFRSLYTRLMPGNGVALIMQRMSTHDLTARVLELAKAKGEHWEVICLPAIAHKESGEPIHYDGTKKSLERLKAGVVLWPEFFTMDMLIDMAQTLGPSEFNAQYQQIPDRASGQIIKAAWLRHWSERDTRAEGRMELPSMRTMDIVLQSWDLRFKGDSKNDVRSSYVVGQVWAFKGPDAFLLDQSRGQLGFDDSVKAILALSSKWPQARLKLIENKANGPAAETQLRKKLSGLRLVDPLGGDKEARLRACETEFAAGNVHFPPPEVEAYDFVPGFVKRLLTFPATPNDEGDALSQALNWRYAKHNKLKELNQ
jgi:predicted phage terminase large subunit-like protein